MRCGRRVLLKTRRRRGIPMRIIQMADREQPVATNTQAPSDDIWSKCPSCKEMAFRKEVERNLNVCPKCGHHFRLTVGQRLSVSVDRGSWREVMADLAIGDPLGFVDSKPYPARMEQARTRSGRNDAVVVGIGKIENRPVAIGVMDFEFMGGSMGVVVGEKLARLFDLACERKLPVIVFAASGAMLGDLNLSEPGALIGFAGRRVTEQTAGQQLPADFQRSEFLLAHGMLDAIVPRHQMRFTLARLLAMLTKPRANRSPNSQRRKK